MLKHIQFTVILWLAGINSSAMARALCLWYTNVSIYTTDMSDVCLLATERNYAKCIDQGYRLKLHFHKANASQVVYRVYTLHAWMRYAHSCLSAEDAPRLIAHTHPCSPSINQRYNRAHFVITRYKT